jgi:hypothetical protein
VGLDCRPEKGADLVQKTLTGVGEKGVGDSGLTLERISGDVVGRLYDYHDLLRSCASDTTIERLAVIVETEVKNWHRDMLTYLRLTKVLEIAEISWVSLLTSRIVVGQKLASP